MNELSIQTLPKVLQCYECALGLWNICITSTITCQTGQQCYSGVGKAAGFFQLSMKGCLQAIDCNQTSDVTFPAGSNSTIYKMTKTCCSTDLCNTAPSLPHLHTLSLLLFSLMSVFIAKVMPFLHIAM
uniref:UPAR/Ly6 domain-containing protein n=1 Tax=Electrophorus electricus TaxID=8005 RepID=A0A4W4GFN5_ELEEL